MLNTTNIFLQGSSDQEGCCDEESALLDLGQSPSHNHLDPSKLPTGL